MSSFYEQGVCSKDSTTRKSVCHYSFNVHYPAQLHLCFPSTTSGLVGAINFFLLLSLFFYFLSCTWDFSGYIRKLLLLQLLLLLKWSCSISVLPNGLFTCVANFIVFLSSYSIGTLRSHHNYAEKQLAIPLNVAAAGDVTIAVYHARSSFGKVSAANAQNCVEVHLLCEQS